MENCAKRGIYKKNLAEKRKTMLYVGRDVTKSRRGKIHASAVAERRSTWALCLRKKRSEKNRPKIGRGIKNAAKATKKPALMIFSFVKSFKKKREREREKERQRSSTWHHRTTGPLEPVHACHIERLTPPQGW